MRHVAGDDRQPDVHLAQKGLDLDHFGDLARRRDEGVEGVGLRLFQGKSQAHGHGVPQGRPVDARAPPPQKAALLKPGQTPRGAQRRHPGPVGQFGPAQRRVGLQLAQKAAVEVIQHEKCRISENDA